MTDPSTTPTISQRQQEVLELLAKGLSQKEAARLLGISPHTVHTHLQVVFSRTGAINTTHAVFILRHTILTT